ncbi:transcription-repair coupling factor (superfamily II helicase) [Desulfosalsimonas propionicica]|uniref:Transcription-repair-coupling factor n=1 Tax=Desulfosalsimonas propionicica TaxID=332175 RepID=A0A7W0HKY5_9BACT|nr:transcription-repair coupling factor [Desulfosalsimonas propionicica]MBA2881688.1 transcription-repair coupling factor (superfamily II helicase) [Desulfosalsimonas propionicica]
MPKTTISALRAQQTSIIEDIGQRLASGTRTLICTGASGGQGAYLVSRLARHTMRPVFVVTASMGEAENFAQDLNFFAGPDSPEPCVFSPYNILPFKRVSYHNEIAARRIRILYQLATGHRDAGLVVAPVETLLQQIIPRQELADYADLLMVNEEIDRDGLVEKLTSGGYNHAAMVEEPGDYSVRGDIVDVFSPMYENPLRVELFGDTVESIRLFSASSQRKLQSLSEAVILPAREAVLHKHQLHHIIERTRSQRQAAGLPKSAETEFVERIREEGIFAGVESLLPLIYGELDTVFDYMPTNALVIAADTGAIEKAAVDKQDLAVRNYDSACQDQRMCVSPEQIYQDWDEAKACLEKHQQILFREIDIYSPAKARTPDADRIDLSVDDLSDLEASLGGHRRDEQILKPLAGWINQHCNSGYTTVMVCRSKSQARRLLDLIEAYEIQPQIISDFSEMPAFSSKPGICIGRLSSGFVWHDQQLALVTDRQIFGTRVRPRSRKDARQTVQSAFLDFADLNAGDLVVHMDHGIGRYQGLEKITLEGVTNDFLVLEYRGGDKLFVPVDRMDIVQKYMGVDDVAPVVDKLGGTSWARVKSKAKKSVEKIAGDLLDLYARRKVQQGYAFGVADSYYKDFEAGFPYEETEDQLKAISDVISDMESDVPMDRLICGDVGYGKTEVALRAAFKAVNDGKQVAVLVPTTLLAEQHFRTFSERFERYPVSVESLNRFRTRKQQTQIIEGLKQGRVDVVIGTHRLLQKDMAFKDLGLIIIDEEQRFGVRHKEKLKKMRTSVDVLSMTATPIPRTLHMSMLGVRDISVITTPPELRHPIISYISEFDAAVIAEAIRSELARGGQIFFVHNNISTIDNMARRLSEMVPEVRMGVAHGRLGEDALERVMYGFINKDIDMLVSTTIVESGLDIPNANTMIINRADRMGLAQLYQLRGRVGRADTQAYAYMIVPREAALSRDAQKRLKVVMEHSDLGAGFQIALNDLKIRGGGAALGVSQSGHIAAVGYDMFLKLMEEAVGRLKGEAVTEPLEPEINIPVSVFIPESYIADIDQRLAAYRRLARMTDLKDVADFREELTDRYGKPPAEALHLLLKIMLRILAVRAGVRRLDLTWETMSLSFSGMHQKNPHGLMDLIQSDPGRYRFTPDHVLCVPMGKTRINSLMNQAKKILMEIATYVNN